MAGCSVSAWRRPGRAVTVASGPRSSAMATPTSMVAVSMARILTPRPPCSRRALPAAPPPGRSTRRHGPRGRPCARRRLAPAETHDEGVGAVEGLGRVPRFDDHDAALVELLLQGEVDDLLQVAETPEVDVGHRRRGPVLWASVNVGLVTGSLPPSAATTPWTKWSCRRRASRRGARRHRRGETAPRRRRGPGSLRSRSSPPGSRSTGPAHGLRRRHRRNFFARMRSARISATTTPPPRSA